MGEECINLSRLRTFLLDEHRASNRLKVANVAMRCDRDPEVNREKMIDTIDNIMENDSEVELVIFGEMTLGWYQPGSFPEYHLQISEPTYGETTRALASLAKQHNIYVCYGISELEGGILSNAQILLNPQGEIQAVHRKRNLQEDEVEANYQPGPEMVTITDVKGFKTGIVICSDTASFRIMWELIKSRLDVIIISLTDDIEDDFVIKFQGRLFDAWVITANRYGKENKKYWPGLIVVTDPLGDIRSEKAGREQFSINELYRSGQRRILRDLMRNVWVKLRLGIHILRNLKRALTYV